MIWVGEKQPMSLPADKADAEIRNPSAYHQTPMQCCREMQAHKNALPYLKTASSFEAKHTDLPRYFVRRSLNKKDPKKQEMVPNLLIRAEYYPQLSLSMKTWSMSIKDVYTGGGGK